jgi:hypothetical protein
VMYQIQIKLRSDSTAKDQEKILVQTANSNCDRSAGMKDRSTFLPWGAPMSGMEKTMRRLPCRI